MKTLLLGYDAIAYAERHGVRLHKYADPTEGARDDLTPDEARAVAADDPSLVYLDVESPLAAEIDDDTVRVRDPRGGIWYPDEEAEAEIRAASDPEARAVEIASAEPMRGAWCD